MAHYRSEFRVAVREALAAHSRFSGFTVLPVWRGVIDDQTLPVIGVLTPSDRRERPSRSGVTCRTLLQVAVRRSGGEDIEDLLDLDSEVVEAVVTQALLKMQQGCFLENTSLATNTDGRQNVGTMVMDFGLTSFRNIPT
mgnify:CR=1 FL=1